MLKKYKIILFDLDGTVADTDKTIVETYKELYSVFKPEANVSEDKMITFSGPPIRDTMKNEFSDYDVDFMISEYQKRTKKYYERYVKTYPLVIETLKELKEKGVKIGVVTNKVRSATLITFDLCGLNDIFDVVVCQDDVVHSKPHKEHILEALRLLNHYCLDEVLYVGDNDIDYVSAANAGIDAMLVRFAKRDLRLADKFKYCITSFEEIKNYV